MVWKCVNLKHKCSKHKFSRFVKLQLCFCSKPEFCYSCWEWQRVCVGHCAFNLREILSLVLFLALPLGRIWCVSLRKLSCFQSCHKGLSFPGNLTIYVLYSNWLLLEVHKQDNYCEPVKNMHLWAPGLIHSPSAHPLFCRYWACSHLISLAFVSFFSSQLSSSSTYVWA